MRSLDTVDLYLSPVYRRVSHVPTIPSFLWVNRVKAVLNH